MPPAAARAAEAAESGDDVSEADSADEISDEDEVEVELPIKVRDGKSKGIPVRPPRSSAEPLPGDVARITTTRDVREGESVQKNKQRSANTRAKQYDLARTKWFGEFCTWSGWNYAKSLIWVTSDGQIPPETDAIFRQFFDYLENTEGMKKPTFMGAVLPLVGAVRPESPG